MNIELLSAIVAASATAASLIGSQSIRAVVGAIFRSPKHDTVLVHRPDGQVETIDYDDLAKFGKKRTHTDGDEASE